MMNPRYEIRLKGTIDERWSQWLIEADFEVEASNEPPLTILRCAPRDQAQLRGILNQLWDLNFELISMLQIAEPSAAEPQENRGGQAWHSV